MGDGFEQNSQPQTGPEPPKHAAPFPVIGLGASAGGLQALKDFFAHMPDESGMAFVVIMHLSAKHESHVAEILQAMTGMPVTQVNESVRVEQNHIYVIPPTKQMNKLRILLAEDHETIRDGLRLLINSQPDMETIGEADNGRIAVRLAQELLLDVVVMDVSMPELNGLQATKWLGQKCPQVKVLTLTRHTNDGYLQQLLQAGASGYVLKQSKSAELLRAIRAVAAGQMYLDPAIAKKAITQIRVRGGTARGASPDANLSDREAEVLRFIALGYINKEVAVRLSLSVKTVEAHKANGMRKMGMKNRVDIVRYALLRGWLQDI